MTEETKTKTTRRKAKPKPEPKPEPKATTVEEQQLSNGRTRVVYPNGIVIDK